MDRKKYHLLSYRWHFLINKYPVNYFINSTLRFTNLSRSAPLSIPLPSNARSANCFANLFFFPKSVSLLRLDSSSFDISLFNESSFSLSACEVFDHYAGDELILLGYENDHKWINDFTGNEN